MNNSNLQLEAALRLLPHGAEFRFVDRLLELQPGQAGVGEYQMRGDEPFLRGHFPGAPLFPGVLMIEAAAQLAGVVGQTDPGIPPLPNLRLTAIRAIKIFGTARPRDIIRLEARTIGRMANLFQSAVRVTLTDQVLLEGEVTLGSSLPVSGSER